MSSLFTESEVKGTVSVNSSDPPCKDGKTGFTTVPLNLYLNNNVEDIVFFF